MPLGEAEVKIRPAHLLFAASIPACMAIPGLATGTPTRVVAPVGPGVPLATARRQGLGHSPLVGPGSNNGCTSNIAPDFIGISGYANYADNLSGILAGQNNEACGVSTGIAAGTSNIVGPFSSGSSVIAGGDNNLVNFSPESFIGAGYNNSINYEPGIYGGGYDSAIGAGQNNAITTPFSFIGAGLKNTTAPGALTTQVANGQSAFVGAGYNNAVAGNYSGIVAGQSNQVAPDNSTVVGGQGNVIKASSGGSTVSANSAIVGGVSNTISTAVSTTGGQSAFIGGGNGNAVSANFASVVGGQLNSAGAADATVGGGYENSASGKYATASGGYANTVSGQNAAVPGGAFNIASGSNSLAAGYGAKAATSGSFVWADSSAGGKTITSTVANQFLARAAGGVIFYSSATLASGVQLAAGSGAWSTLSDRAAKTAIARVDDAAVLAKIAALPISEWSYTAQGTGIRHLGPMAQDFRAAFGLGEDDRHISTVDEEGIALAAIKALQRENAVLQTGNAALQAQSATLRATSAVLQAQSAAKDRKIGDLEAKYTQLAARLDALEAKLR